MLALVAGVVAGVVAARRPLPQVDGTLQVAGLHGDVDVVRDAHGIPQVYADNSADLFFAQGYVQAQDRFYEMDFRRHVTAGRLSELFGKRPLETDMFIRTMGWRRVAAAGATTCSRRRPAPTSTPTATGVNAYLDGQLATSCPLEYTVLGLAASTTSRRSGRRSTRWPGSRRWRGTCAATWTRRSRARRLVGGPDAGAGRRALPALPLRPERADRRRTRRR